MFKKVVDSRYIIEQKSTDVLGQKNMDVLISIVDDKYDYIINSDYKYNNAVNEELYMLILGRTISDLFIEEKKDHLKNNDYVTIDFMFKNKKYLATLGMLEQEYINGIKLIT